MSKRIVLPGILAIILVLAVGGAVFAQTGSPGTGQTPNATTPATPNLGKGLGFGFGLGGRLGNGKMDWTLFDSVASALNLSPDELFNQLHSGKTLSEIATAQNKTLSDVEKAVQDARTTEMTNAINQAVKDGKISQAQADWLLQGLKNGWSRGFGMRGFGRGPMMRGGVLGGKFGGMRGGMNGAQGGQPLAQPTPNA